MRILSLIAALLVLLAAPARADDAVTVNRKTTTYAVTGVTADAIVASMDARSPFRREGFRGITTFRFSWDFDAVSGRDDAGQRTCTAANPRVAIDIEIVLPAHAGIDAAPAALRRAWTAYIAAFTRHEDRHARDFVRIGSRIPAALDGLSAASCLALRRLANTTAQVFVTEAQDASDAYDRRTRFGETEGVVFP